MLTASAALLSFQEHAQLAVPPPAGSGPACRWPRHPRGDEEKSAALRCAATAAPAPGAVLDRFRVPREITCPGRAARLAVRKHVFPDGALRAPVEVAPFTRFVCGRGGFSQPPGKRVPCPFLSLAWRIGVRLERVLCPRATCNLGLSASRVGVLTTSCTLP